jgi:hypothetical protein
MGEVYPVSPQCQVKFREIPDARQNPAFPSSFRGRYRAEMPAVPAFFLDPLSAAVGLLAVVAVGLLLWIVSGSGRW